MLWRFKQKHWHEKIKVETFSTAMDPSTYEGWLDLAWSVPWSKRIWSSFVLSHVDLSLGFNGTQLIQSSFQPRGSHTMRTRMFHRGNLRVQDGIWLQLDATRLNAIDQLYVFDLQDHRKNPIHVQIRTVVTFCCAERWNQGVCNIDGTETEATTQNVKFSCVAVDSIFLPSPSTQFRTWKET